MTKLKSKFLRAAVTGAIVAVISSPAGAQEARTGDLERDCSHFWLASCENKSTCKMEALCRINDNTNDVTTRYVDLAKKVGVDSANFAKLKWGGTDFHKQCKDLALTGSWNGVILEATCEYSACSDPSAGDVFCIVQDVTSELSLEDYLEVDDSGNIVEKDY